MLRPRLKAEKDSEADGRGLVVAAKCATIKLSITARSQIGQNDGRRGQVHVVQEQMTPNAPELRGKHKITQTPSVCSFFGQTVAISSLRLRHRAGDRCQLVISHPSMTTLIYTRDQSL